MVEWLRDHDSPLVRRHALSGRWVDARPPWALGRAAGGRPGRTCAREWRRERGSAGGALSSSGLPSGGETIRRRQRGLMLLSAHRAKGLEFDHVAVLDGGWDRPGKGDEDAGRSSPPLLRRHDPRPSRPSSLTRFAGAAGRRAGRASSGSPKLPPTPDARTRCRHAFRDGGPMLCTAAPPGAHAPTHPELARRYRRPRLGMNDVYLELRGTATHLGARCTAPSPALSPGDPLEVRVDGRGRWNLLDEIRNSRRPVWPRASSPRSELGAHPLPSLPSSRGAATRRIPSTRTASSATLGRWSYRSWCSSRRTDVPRRRRRFAPDQHAVRCNEPVPDTESETSRCH